MRNLLIQIFRVEGGTIQILFLRHLSFLIQGLQARILFDSFDIFHGDILDTLL